MIFFLDKREIINSWHEKSKSSSALFHMSMSNNIDTNIEKKTKISANKFPPLMWFFQDTP